MSRVMNFLGGLLGGQPEEPQPSEAEETIQKLCEQVASSTLLQDRRDAVRALKSLSKTYREEVGKQAMEHLVHVMQTDQFDSEILGYALATLQNIICNDEEEEPDENTRKQREDLVMKFIQDSKNVTLVLTLLNEFDFHVRWPGVKLLTALLKHQCAQVQGIILVSHLGVSRLMDLLQDSREVIRNDVLLLLRQLTKNNTAIQKIVAFQNAFEHLLDIITEEGSSDGGIVVEDCLQLLLNLLKNNNSNQNFFKEGYYIQRMTPWFEVGEDYSGWSVQKVTILHLMLQLVRVMVSPVNYPGADTASCQKSMFQSGLLQQLCTVIMATTRVPVDIRTQTINTVSEVIRGSQLNQDYFASVNVPIPSNAPRPAITWLTYMVIGQEPFELRCAALYFFQCFLYKNQKGQGEIVATLLQPSSTTAEANIPAGRLLCAGLLSADSLSNWFAAVALAHALQGNLTQKEQLLRVQLATSLGKPVCLLQQCTNILSQGGKVQTRVGLLMLLCTWISNCPIAVKHFLQNQVNVPFLLGQISENSENERLVEGLCALLLGICIYYNDNSLKNYTKEKLKQLIEMRIGKENFVEKLGYVTKHELYPRATQRPQPVPPSPEQMLLDHEFTKLIRELEDVIIKAVLKSSEEEETLAQYKELIGKQEAKLAKAAELESRLAAQTSETEKLKVEVRRLSEGRAGLEKQLSSATMSVAILQTEKSKQDEKIQGLKLCLKDIDKDILTKEEAVQLIATMQKFI